jgi:hypothetical protein
MSGARPKVSASLLSALTTTVPARLTKKLDAHPTAADAWVWTVGASETTVVTDGRETVTLRHEHGVVAGAEQLRCTCLLSPRCFHLLAVVALLEAHVEGADGDAARAPDPQPSVGDAPAAAVALTPSQVAAARLGWRTASDVLVAGAMGSGAVLQAELLRAAHEARAEGLHRLASAALRVVRGVRDLRAEAPEFSLDSYVADLGDLLTTAHVLARAGEGLPGDELPGFVGVARRSYGPAGDLHLVGLFTEPIIAASGYAGVVTYLCDARGRVWTVSDVVPGEAGRARGAYDAGVRIGDVSVSHRRLAREGLFVQGATGSADMRLGSGAAVRAARASATTWLDDVPRTLWEAPIEAQVERAYGALAAGAPSERPGGAVLLFVRGRVLGAERGALVVEIVRGADARPLRVVAPLDHEATSYRDNLALLARAPGLPLRIIGRIVPERPRTMAGLAVGPEAREKEGPFGGGAPEEKPGDARLRLPDDWGGRAMLGLDRLQAAHVAGTSPCEAVVAVQESTRADPLLALHRRVQRLALGGARSLPPSALPELLREGADVARRMMPAAAAILRAIVGAVESPARSLERADALARAWLAASTYEHRARREIESATWLW